MSKLVHSIKTDRRDWVEGWSKMMIKIWEERLDMLDVGITGNLYRTLSEANFHAQDPVFEVTHSFPYYGIYVDRGTGREIAKGNPGDLGFTPIREPKRWYSVKHYASVKKLQEYMAESFGKEAVTMIKEQLES